MKRERKKLYEAKDDRVKKQKEENTAPSVFTKMKQTVKQRLFILAEAKRKRKCTISKIYGIQLLFIKIYFIRYLLHQTTERAVRPLLCWHFRRMKFCDRARVLVNQSFLHNWTFHDTSADLLKSNWPRTVF